MPNEILRSLQRGHHRKALKLVEARGAVMPADDLLQVLWQAAVSGAPEVVKAVLDLGVPVDAADAEGTTALMRAAHLGRPTTLRLLMERGAEVNRARKDGRTALMQAAQGGDTECVEALLGAGADPDARTPEGECPLTAASGNGKWSVVELLLGAGAQAAVDEADGVPLLSRIVHRAGHLVDLALSRGADVSSASRFGERTPLHDAARAGDPQAVRALVAQGADLEALDADSRTPLLCALDPLDGTGDVVGTVGALLELGANVHVTTPSGDGALSSAAANLPCPVALEIVAMLLETGVSVAPLQGDGTSALHAAAACGCLEVLELLLDAGIDPEDRRPGGQTALMSAAAGGAVALSTAKALLDRGARVDVWTDDGRSLVAVTARTGSVAMLRLLVGHGAPIEPRDGRDPSPILWAASAGHPTMVQALLELGLDPDTPARGGSVLDLPAHQADTSMVRLLLDAGADPNRGPPYPLVRAVEHATEGIWDGRPYNRPKSRKHDRAADVVELLLEAGADPNPPCDGRSLLDLAKQFRCREVVGMIKRAGGRGGDSRSPLEPSTGSE